MGIKTVKNSKLLANAQLAIEQKHCADVGKKGEDAT